MNPSEPFFCSTGAKRVETVLISIRIHRCLDAGQDDGQEDAFPLQRVRVMLGARLLVGLSFFVQVEQGASGIERIDFGHEPGSERPR